MIRFYGEELLAPRPTTKLEDHLLSALRPLIQHIPIYSQLPSTLEAVPPSATWGRAMLWWQGPTYHAAVFYTPVNNRWTHWTGVSVNRSAGQDRADEKNLLRFRESNPDSLVVQTVT